mmetsp:Transcript_52256/g.87167  ORF Transcript_52256/g.87167 Transcript_52256/m.87167 type:complete len:309 (+) Transcript_52256:1806-2732(+)
MDHGVAEGTAAAGAGAAGDVVDAAPPLVLGQIRVGLDRATAVGALHVPPPVPRVRALVAVHVVGPHELHRRRAAAARLDVRVPVQLRQLVRRKTAAAVEAVHVLRAHVVDRPHAGERHQRVVGERGQRRGDRNALVVPLPVRRNAGSRGNARPGVHHDAVGPPAVLRDERRDRVNSCVVVLRIARLDVRATPAVGRPNEIRVPLRHVDDGLGVQMVRVLGVLRQYLPLPLGGHIPQPYLGDYNPQVLAGNLLLSTFPQEAVDSNVKAGGVTDVYYAMELQHIHLVPLKFYVWSALHLWHQIINKQPQH